MIGVRSDALVKMARFPSEEWTKLYAEKLNANKSYEDAGKNWEGAITFVVQKDSALDKDAFIYLDLYHGKCRDAKFSLTESDLPTPEYKYAGSYGNWRSLKIQL